MDMHYSFRRLDTSGALKSYVEGKLEKLEKYLIKAYKINVTFSLERFIHRVDIVLFEKKQVFKAQGKANDMYASIDLAMHVLEEQLKRYKEKIKSHKERFFNQVPPFSKKKKAA